MVDRIDAVLLDDILEPVGLGHVERFERAGRGVLGQGLDVGGDNVFAAVFLGQGLEELRADLSGSPGNENAGR